MNKEPKAFFRLVREFFVVYMPKQKGASENTIRSYRAALSMFLAYSCLKLGIQLKDFCFQYSTRELLESFLETECCRSIASRNQRLAAIRRFYRFAAEKDPMVIDIYNEMVLIPVKKEPEHEIEFFSEVALTAILSEPDISTKKGIRDLVFLVLMYDTGARVQEILDIKLFDLHIYGTEKYVVLTGKGSKTRLVPLMQKTVDHLNRYIALFHSADSTTSYLFYTVRNGETGQMSQDNIAKILKKYGDAARTKCNEVPEHLYAHMFRHSRAMHLYRNGMPMPLLSEWLGHTQMETTIRYYANADIRMKKEAIDKATSEFNPILKSDVEYTYEDEETLKKLYGLA